MVPLSDCPVKDCRVKMVDFLGGTIQKYIYMYRYIYSFIKFISICAQRMQCSNGQSSTTSMAWPSDARRTVAREPS